METRITAELSADRCNLDLRVAESRWVGKRATLWIQQHVRNHRKRRFESMIQRPIGTQVLAAEQRLPVQHLEHAFDYRGEWVDVEWRVRVEIDDGILFDSKLEVPLVLPDFPRAAAEVNEAARQLWDPVDQRSLRARFRALLPEDRRRLGLISVSTLVVMLTNLAIGWHDAGVPVTDAILYDHDWSSGGPRYDGLPMLKALMGSLLLAGAVGFHVAIELIRYIRFGFRIRNLPKPNVVMPAAQLLQGVARIPLSGAEVRVVAANIEYCEVPSGSGSRRTEHQAARAICVFRQLLPPVPAHQPIENYLVGNIDFSPVYAALYPPASISRLGITLEWRIQLLHPQFTDRSFDGWVRHLEPAAFFRTEHD